MMEQVGKKKISIHPIKRDAKVKGSIQETRLEVTRIQTRFMKGKNNFISKEYKRETIYVDIDFLLSF